MTWLIRINTAEGDWYQVVAVSIDAKEAIEMAYDYAESEGFPVDNITAEIFESSVHGDLSDYEILN